MRKGWWEVEGQSEWGRGREREICELADWGRCNSLNQLEKQSNRYYSVSLVVHRWLAPIETQIISGSIV